MLPLIGIRGPGAGAEGVVREGALEGLPDGRPIVLVRVPEVDESVDSAVEMLPTAALEVDLHHLSKGYGVTTPWSFDVSAEFLVENVTDLGEH